MKLHPWIKEYYPVSSGSRKAQANDMARARHSLQKWLGLMPNALKKHGVKLSCSGEVAHNLTEVVILGIDADSCALCKKHYNQSGLGPCPTCPMVLAGNKACSSLTDQSPWHEYIVEHNPRSMIRALKKTIKWLKTNGKRQVKGEQ